MDGGTPSLPNAARGMDGETPTLQNAARGMDGETPSLPMAAQSPTARVQETSEPSIKAAAKHQGRVEAKGVRSGREPSLSRTEFPEPSVSCRSRSASKSRSFSAMGSAASPRRNSLLLSRIFCISKVIWLCGVSQATEAASLDVGSTARPPISHFEARHAQQVTVMGHQSQVVSQSGAGNLTIREGDAVTFGF